MGEMLDACIKKQQREGIYNHPLSWCAREAIRAVEESIEREEQEKQRKPRSPR